jgi:phage replication O-like protein O
MVMANPQPPTTNLPHELLEQFAKLRLSPNEWRVIWSLLRKTYGWQKPDGDAISLSQFQLLTGLKIRHISRALASLIDKHVIADIGTIKVQTHRGTQTVRMFKLRDCKDWQGITSIGDALIGDALTGNTNPEGITSLDKGITSLDKKVSPVQGNTKTTNKNNITKTMVVSEKAKEFSELLKTLIIKNNPDARPSANGKWDKDFDLMLRIDKRTPELIENVLRYSQSDDFWKTNILSPDKLRKHFDQLTAKMNSNKGGTNNGRQSNDPNW